MKYNALNIKPPIIIPPSNLSPKLINVLLWYIVINPSITATTNKIGS